MLDILITLVVIAMVAYMAMSETKYLFGKPTGCVKCGRDGCVSCAKKQTNQGIKAVRDGLKKAVDRVHKETRKIRDLVQKKAPEPIVAVNQIEYIQANANAVSGADPTTNTIDEDLPFASYAGLQKPAKSPLGMIEGVRPPTYADPRVMNPALASAPVQFSAPATFGAFGVTDHVAFSADDMSSDAADAADATLEGFEAYDANGAVLVKDGKIVRSACELPSYQLKDYKHVTTLPMRNLKNPPPMVEDLVEEDMFDGLQGFPIDEEGAMLTPPGTATPGEEFAFMNYGYKN